MKPKAQKHKKATGTDGLCVNLKNLQLLFSRSTQPGVWVRVLLGVVRGGGLEPPRRSTCPSNMRVYQFHHPRIFKKYLIRPTEVNLDHEPCQPREGIFSLHIAHELATEIASFRRRSR